MSFTSKMLILAVVFNQYNMPKSIFLSLIFLLCKCLCFAQADTLRQDTAKHTVAAPYFNVASIIAQITQHYKDKYEGEYEYMIRETDKKNHYIALVFGHVEEGDSFWLTSVIIPYIKKDYFFGDLDDDGVDEVVVNIHTEGDGTGAVDAPNNDIFIFKYLNNAYKLVSMADLEIKNKDGVHEYCYFNVSKVKDGLIWGYSDCQKDGDPPLYRAIHYLWTYKYHNGRWLRQSLRRTKDGLR